MEKEVIAALIGGVALVIAALLGLKKPKAEADKLAAEAKEIRRKPIEADRKEMLDVLKLFDRAAFRPNRPGDPTAAFTAIKETRIELQKRGASYVRDKKVAERFQQIQEQLLEIENRVVAKYPDVPVLATKVVGLPIDNSERTEQVRKTLGDRDYDESAAFIRGEVDAINISSAVQEIKEKIRELDV